MSHTIYHTEGFVIASQDTGEANRYFKIYTKDFGLIGATAQGVRHLKSKLRYSLQDLCFCDISMVRGKGAWRITSASVHQESSINVLENRHSRLVLHRMTMLLKRLVHGEEKDDDLFMILKNGYKFLSQTELTAVEAHNLEVIFVLQILNVLGYLDTPETYLPFIQSDLFSENLLSQMGEKKSGAISVINDAFEAIDL